MLHAGDVITLRKAVTVHCVLPGRTKAEGAADFVARMAAEQRLDAAQFERRYFANDRPSSLIRRFIAPDEMGATIAYLCSPLADATNGAAVRVDGGVVRRIV